MRTVTTSEFEQCTRCGEPVARLKSARTGNLYSVRINMNAITKDGEGNPVLEVGVADFHNCDPEQARAYRAAKAQAPSTTAKAPFASIAKFFNGATEKGAKRIVIKLFASTTTILQLKYSQRRNAVDISDGKEFGYNEYYGSISCVDGTHRPGRNTIDAERKALLVGFENDPVATAVASAKISSSCSFCSLPLDDERSVAAGYGPKCARKYGLPWGNNATAKAMAEEEAKMDKLFADREQEQEAKGAWASMH